MVESEEKYEVRILPPAGKKYYKYLRSKGIRHDKAVEASYQSIGAANYLRQLKLKKVI